MVSEAHNTRVKWEDLAQGHAETPPLTRSVISGRSIKDVAGVSTRSCGWQELRIARSSCTPDAVPTWWHLLQWGRTRCFVPSSSVGMVLGKGGRKIDEISATSTWTEVFKENQEQKQMPCFSVRGFSNTMLHRRWIVSGQLWSHRWCVVGRRISRGRCDAAKRQYRMCSSLITTAHRFRSIVRSHQSMIHSHQPTPHVTNYAPRHQLRPTDTSFTTLSIV